MIKWPNQVGKLALSTSRLQVRQGQVHLETSGPVDRVFVRREAEEWQPIKSLKELSQALKREASDDVGLWQDRRRYVVFGPDGQIQDDEVTTLAQRWSESRLVNCQSVEDPSGREVESAVHFGKIDFALVKTQSTTEGVLVEPARVTRSEHQQVESWGYIRGGYRYPASHRRTIYTAE